jgi:hypothetical protein
MTTAAWRANRRTIIPAQRWGSAPTFDGMKPTLERLIPSLIVAGLTVAMWGVPVLARPGGGSNSSAGSSLLYLILVPVALVYAWYVNQRINRKKAAAEALLATLAQTDPAWEEPHLEVVVRGLFQQIQDAWCQQNLDRLQTFVAPALFVDWSQQIRALRDKRWRNVMEHVELKHVRIVEVRNYAGQSNDAFTACLDATAMDYTVDETGQVVESNSRRGRTRGHQEPSTEPSQEEYREFWTFNRDQDSWKLSRVDQAADWRRSVDAPLVNES